MPPVRGRNLCSLKSGASGPCSQVVDARLRKVGRFKLNATRCIVVSSVPQRIRENISASNHVKPARNTVQTRAVRADVVNYRVPSPFNFDARNQRWHIFFSIDSPFYEKIAAAELYYSIATVFRIQRPLCVRNNSVN